MDKTDVQLKQQIEDELRWDPRINSAQIGVSVNNGAVSLMGAVDTYPEKYAAEEATKRVSGVRSVAQELTVKILSDHVRSDADIASAVQTALTWDLLIPKAVTASVRDGWVTLHGVATWNHQREAAERAVRYLTGVAGVSNSVTLKPQTNPAQVKESIQSALERQALSDTTAIHVDTLGGRVTLTGQVSSWKSIDDAAKAAWAAPGVTEVVDRLRMPEPTT
jgi:osmotically-inducible protein OsmY